MPAVVMPADIPPRCCRCGRGEAVYIIRPHPGIGYCATCYTGLIMGTCHLGEPVFPVRVPV
jgi:hypothetical protein